jgi:hypothetical protein
VKGDSTVNIGLSYECSKRETCALCHIEKVKVTEKADAEVLVAQIIQKFKHNKIN